MSGTLKFMKDKPYAICCEGADEYYFLCWYLEYLIKNEPDHFQDRYCILDLGGIDEMKKRFSSIRKIPDYSSVRSLLFVRDAETDVQGTIYGLCSSMKREWGIESNATGAFKTGTDRVKVGFYLFPDQDLYGAFKNGTLEDLLVQLYKLPPEEVISVTALKSKTDVFIRELEKSRNKQMKTVHKNRLHLLLDCTDSFVGLKIGEAAKAHAYDFGHPLLDGLKKRIWEMQV